MMKSYLICGNLICIMFKKLGFVDFYIKEYFI